MKKCVIFLLAIFFIQPLIAQKKTAIYWDASYSMKDRNLDRELKFLGNYFKKYTEAQIKLVMFSNEIILEQDFKITEGNWKALENELRKTIYDGASSFDQLFKDNVDEYLLFSDGVENISAFNPPKSKPIHIISSVANTNQADLKLVSDQSAGRFFYLPADFESKTKEKKEQLVSGRDDGFISGVIKGSEGNLANVSVVNQTSGAGAASKPDGSFRVEAKEGDILIFSYLGKKTVSVRVSQADIINITMADINQRLEEVVLTAGVEEEVEMVNTGMEERDSRSVGYAVESISSDEVSELDTDLTKAVNGQFSNFEVKSDVYNKTDISQFLGRGKNMSILLNQYGLIVVDGVPLAHSNSGFGGIAYNQDDIINPDMIESITYLKGLAATNRFGTIGRNGVLLITTKNATTIKVEDNKPVIPQGTTAQYTGSAISVSKLPDEPYISALKAAKDVNEAFNIYLDQREAYGDSPYFYIDVHDYFKGWNNPMIAKRILSNVIEIASDRADVLRVVAYKQQQGGQYLEAIKTLEHILDLQPKQSQSYRDLALAYVDAGKYQEAFDLYKQIEDNLNVGSSDFTGIRKTLNNEIKNLLSQHHSKVNMSSGIDPKFNRPVKYKSRIVFEWNDPYAEFDLNVINPQNRFFTWSHTQAENSDRILQQQQQGYGLEEFYLTSGDQGEWKFNMKYFGKTNEKETPTFIKITTYKNFGSANQTKKVDVIRLDKKDIEQTVAKLVVN